MQTCSVCNTSSHDDVVLCPTCGSNLREQSITAVNLKRFQENPRVGVVRISVYDDACPACQKMQGSYPKDQVPRLPVEGCSHPNGCRCTYAPALTEIYP